MAFPFAQLAVALAPTAAKGIANLLRGDRKSPYEKKLNSMADIFEEQATQPLDETTVYKTGKRRLEEADEDRRGQIENSSASSGATDEARLAARGNNNEVYADSLNQLMARAQQYRDQMRSRYLSVLGQQENARRSSDAQFQQKLNSITRPLGTASRAFLMSDIFSGGTESTGVTPGNTPQAKAVGGPTDSAVLDSNSIGGYSYG